MNSVRRQLGVSLVELMIGMAIGLIMISGALAFFGTQVFASYRVLGSSKVQQQLNALMLVMVNDIRRAGYSSAANAENVAANAFSQVGSTAVEVHDDMDSDTNQVDGSGVPNATGSCVVYAYDSDEDGVVDDTDLFGFRLNGDVVEMRRQGDSAGTMNSCSDDDANPGDWDAVTDSASIAITGLSFDLRPSSCLNTAEPDGVDDDGDGTIDEDEEADCYSVPVPAGNGDVTVEIRQLTITVDGQLANEASARASVTQTLKIRNDLVRVR
jgi:type IV pilus assembly protein PilW